MQPTELLNQLAQFTGSETFTRHALRHSMLMTEGVVFVAEAAQAHWLTDAIASHQHDQRVRAEEFQVWRLSVDVQTRRATLTMSDGNSEAPIITQVIEYTDFPLDLIEMWMVASGDHWVLMLPSEY